MIDITQLIAMKPTPKRGKSDPSPWSGQDGEAARAKGILTPEQLRIVNAIAEEHGRTRKSERAERILWRLDRPR